MKTPKWFDDMAAVMPGMFAWLVVVMLVLLITIGGWYITMLAYTMSFCEAFKIITAPGSITRPILVALSMALASAAYIKGNK